MRISKDQVIAGVPAEHARALVRLFRHGGYTERAEQLVGDRAYDVLSALAQDGYLERSTDGHDHIWETTMAGSALAQASLAKPITRSTADRLIEQLVQRARAFNADPSYLVSAGRLTVFGSYLDPTIERLGDVDIELHIYRRPTPPGTDFTTAARDYATNSGRRFTSYLDFLFWPDRELHLALRNRSTALSITHQDVTRFTQNTKTIYDIADDPEALPAARVETEIR